MAHTTVDSLALLTADVGYGHVGLHGAMGYEGKAVSINGQGRRHAVSAHPPSRVVFETGGKFASFCADVGFNDDVKDTDAHAAFMVRADGRLAAVASFVSAGSAPVPIHADISGAHTLELIVRSGRWEDGHGVWIDPTVTTASATERSRSLVDCLGRVTIAVPERLPRATRCVATVVTPGFERMLDDLLGSLHLFGNCRDARIVVFIVDGNDACRRVVEKYGALSIACTRRANVNATVKAVLYTAPLVVDADQFVCLDADMLVLGDLRPVFATLDACPEGSVLACREGNSRGNRGALSLEHAIQAIYGGHANDFGRILGRIDGEPQYPLVVNDGLFAGGRTALLELEGVIRSWAGATNWVDERRDVGWRNQFIFNLALARLRCGVELDPVFNINLHCQDVEWRRGQGRAEAIWHGRLTRVLHFNGWGRRKYLPWRNQYSRPTGMPSFR